MKSKKIFSIGLIALGLFTLNVKADEAESGSIILGSYEDAAAAIIYSFGTVNNTAVSGATYDKTTYTLTLEDVNSTKCLNVMELGESLIVNVKGTNKLGCIMTSGSGLTVTGDGSLTINETKSSKYGIQLNPADGENLVVDENVTLRVYGTKYAIEVSGVASTDSSKMIVFKNGQDTSSVLKYKKAYYESPENMPGIILGDNPTPHDLYKKGNLYYTVNNYSSKYSISNVVGKVDGKDIYILDLSGMPNYDTTEYDSLDDLMAAGYELAVASGTVYNPTSTGTYRVGYVGDVKKYVVGETYNSTNGTWETKVYDITSDTATLKDGKIYTLLTLNETATEDDLEYKYVEYELVPGEYSQDKTQRYAHYIDSKDYTVSPKKADNEETKEEVKQDEKVEEKETLVKADDTKDTNDKEAVEEVNKIVQKIAKETNSEKVTGVSKETFNKIKEAIEDGKEITTELTAKTIKSDDVKEETKKKVEESIEKTDVVLGYFDINLNVKADGETLGNVTLLEEGIKVTIDAKELVESLPKVESGLVRKYKVVRIHDGEVTILNATLNEDGTISFVTDRFSDYIVTYSDVKEEKSPATGDNVLVSIIVSSISLLSLAVVAIKKLN